MPQRGVLCVLVCPQVLSVQTALSIQSHPDKKLAEKLHAQQPKVRNAVAAAPAAANTCTKVSSNESLPVNNHQAQHTAGARLPCPTRLSQGATISASW